MSEAPLYPSTRHAHSATPSLYSCEVLGGPTALLRPGPQNHPRGGGVSLTASHPCIRESEAYMVYADITERVFLPVRLDAFHEPMASESAPDLRQGS